VPDVHFDLDRHISRVALPSPGTADQFDVLISEFLSRPLVRTRPLWQLVIVEGLEDGRVAAALKVHHALADGVSGAETFASLFDISPRYAHRPPKWTTRQANRSRRIRCRSCSKVFVDCAPSRRSP